MSAQHFSNLEAKVKSAGNLNNATEALVVGLADELNNLTQDPVAIKQLADDLRANSADLVGAIVAKAPPPPTTPPAPAAKPTGRGGH